MVINPMFRLRGHLVKGERLCIPKIEVEIQVEPEVKVRKKKEKV